MRRFIQCVREILHRPKIPCFIYAPWLGCFGVHFSTLSGDCIRWWGYSPIRWVSIYNAASRDSSVKAVFLYFRLTADRKAVVLLTHIKYPKRTGDNHVKGNAKQ